MPNFPYEDLSLLLERVRSDVAFFEGQYDCAEVSSFLKTLELLLVEKIEPWNF